MTRVSSESHRGASGVVVIAVSAVFFAALAIVTRLLAGRVPAAQVSALRFAVGLVGVAGLFAARRRGPNLGRRGLLLMRGLFGGGAVLTYFFAIEQLGAAPATVLNYSSPIFATLFAYMFLRERPPLTQRAGLIAATVGAGVVAFSTGQQGHVVSAAAGLTAGVVSAVLGGAAMTVMKKVRDDTDSLTVFMSFCGVGLVMSLPVAAPTWVPLTVETATLCVIVGVLGLLGQVLFTWGMGHTTATVGSATTQLVPAIAWSIAIGWLHEPVAPLAVGGALLCVGGVAMGAVSAHAQRRAAAMVRDP
jgi:drug/metabolite transporter (DMT)-like permease